MSLTTADSVQDALVMDFDLARLDLASARAAQRRKDTPAARARVVACRRRIDGILDAWNAGVRVPL